MNTCGLAFLFFFVTTEALSIAIKENICKNERFKIFNEDCIKGSKKYIKSESVDLIICDPPFSIGEEKFGHQYNRDKRKIIPGYVPAPLEYGKFSFDWIEEAKRILKPDGSMYIVSGFTNLKHLLCATHDLNLNLVNVIAWKYQFGVYTKNKYVTSHYQILYLTKSKYVKPTFNIYCRFGPNAKTTTGGSMAYQDREDVWQIPKQFNRGDLQNINRLPDELIRKMIDYSSNPGEIVCDFFMGNFTTAKVALKMGRCVTGFELNKYAYKHFIRILNK